MVCNTPRGIEQNVYSEIVVLGRHWIEKAFALHLERSFHSYVDHRGPGDFCQRGAVQKQT